MKRTAIAALGLLLAWPGASCKSSEKPGGQPADKPAGGRSAAQTAKRPPGGALPFVEVPNPRAGQNPTHPEVARDVPQIGKSFRDARFGTLLRRVTKIDGTHGRHEYSRFDPFNRGQSMIVLTLDGDWMVYRTGKTPYNQKGNLVATLRDVEEPRWDPADPNILWGLADFNLLKIDVRNGKKTVAKDFRKDPKLGPILKAEPDLYRVTTKNEGEASHDMRYWALMLQGKNEDYRLRYLFTWDRKADRVLGLRKLEKADEIDWAGMSWSGKHVLIGGDPGTGRVSGLCMASLDLKKVHRLAPATAHSDVGVDVNGNDVIVMQNTRTDHVDLIPIDFKTTPTGEGDDPYAGTNRVPLIRLFYSDESPHGFHGGIHVSCNVPGYAVISTYAEPGVKEQNWLDRALVLIRLDPKRPRVFYLAKLHNTTGAYWEETHAAITRDGAKVVWASNWNRNVGKEQVFLMQLDMPKNWRQILAR